jgi:hypothetical protein
VKYILWSFPSAQDAWGYGPKRLQKSSDGGLTFVNVIESLMGRCDMKDLELMAVVARRIWFHRNFVLHGVTFTHPTQVFQEASNSLDDFKGLNVRELDLRSHINEEEAPMIFWKIIHKTPLNYQV